MRYNEWKKGPTASQSSSRYGLGREGADMGEDTTTTTERTGAEFKAIRERLGWSQREIASELGEDHDTVKKWENPGSVSHGWKVREHVWDWLDKRVEEFEDEVDRRVVDAHDYIEHTGAQTVTILYRRVGMYHSMKLDSRGRRHACPVGVANAVAREVGDYLVSEGYEVRYDWPEDDRDTRFFAHDGKY